MENESVCGMLAPIAVEPDYCSTLIYSVLQCGLSGSESIYREVLGMKVTIDQDGCIECGVCEQVCSDVFSVESGEKASVVEKYRTDSPAVGDVPDDLADCAEEGVSSCPVQVISTG